METETFHKSWSSQDLTCGHGCAPEAKNITLSLHFIHHHSSIHHTVNVLSFHPVDMCWCSFVKMLVLCNAIFFPVEISETRGIIIVLARFEVGNVAVNTGACF